MTVRKGLGPENHAPGQVIVHLSAPQSLLWGVHVKFRDLFPSEPRLRTLSEKGREPTANALEQEV